jgi:S1-C subfamily serine protease
MRGLLILLLCSSGAMAAEKLTTLNITAESIGTIVGTNGQVVGTGFVVGTETNVITCDHVVAPQTSLEFHFVNTTGAHVPMSLDTVLRRYDLAVLSVSPPTRLRPLPYGDIRRVRPGDDVVYVGWNVPAQTFRAAKATVTAVGVAFNDGATVDFIEFEGEGIPGYSGGPILNTKGEVIALMREAWNKRGVKGGPEVLVNRGFSIEPAMLAKEVYYPTTGGAAVPAVGTNTISIRLDAKEP